MSARPRAKSPRPSRLDDVLRMGICNGKQPSETGVVQRSRTKESVDVKEFDDCKQRLAELEEKLIQAEKAAKFEREIEAERVAAAEEARIEAEGQLLVQAKRHELEEARSQEQERALRQQLEALRQQLEALRKQQKKRNLEQND